MGLADPRSAYSTTSWFFPRMIEEQIDFEVVAANLHRNLATHESEPRAELQQEALDVLD